MEAWYLVCYEPGKEKLYRAQLSLSLKNITVFCPMLRTWRPRTDCNGVRPFIEPLFRGYLFAYLDPEVIHPSRIEEECSGVSKFVRYGQEIKPLPASVMDTLMALPACADERDVVPKAAKQEKAAQRPYRPPRKRKQRMSNPSPLQSVLYDKISRIVSTDNEMQRTAMFLALTKSFHDHTDHPGNR